MTILHSSSGRPYCSTDAKIQAVLPQLSELRLMSLTKQLSRNRKQLYLTHGNLETELDKSKQHIDREHKLADDRRTHLINPYRKTLFHVRGIQKCLERRKTELQLENASDKYGQYGGLEVKYLKTEIDVIMKENSYQNIKMKQCRKVLAESKADGRIMNLNHCLPVLEAILNRPAMPLRRGKALGFDSSPLSASALGGDNARVTKTNFHLPPVTATRLYTPAKSKRGIQPDIEPPDRANTVG